MAGSNHAVSFLADRPVIEIAGDKDRPPVIRSDGQLQGKALVFGHFAVLQI